MIKRIKAAFRTNEPQVMAVIVFTCLNGIALLKRTNDTPIWFIIVALLFWPMIAFINNLFSPIPKYENSDS